MGTLYGEMTTADWLRAKKLAPHDVPRTLIMVGEDWDPPARMAELEGLLDVVVARPRWNVVIGDRAGIRVGLANVCWGPMAAMVAHQFFAMGTEQIVLVGYYGGLDPTLGYGRVLIVDAATGEDGATNAYAPRNAEQGADRELATNAVALLAQRGLAWTRGRVVTTDAMLLEDRATIERWIAAGYSGVDGETASVYAVARHFDRSALALLTCSDLLVAGDSLYEISSTDGSACDDTFDALLEVALELARRTLVTPSLLAPRVDSTFKVTT
jgi:purine-nucleoside phosphorylase